MTHLTMYTPYETDSSRWRHGELITRLEGDAVFVDDRLLMVVRAPEGTKLEWKCTIPMEGGEPLNNALRLNFDLAPGEERAVDLIVAGMDELLPAEELPRMRAVDFDAALAATEDRWRRLLEPGMKFDVPEPRLMFTRQSF